jgi:hypothetical protein
VCWGDEGDGLRKELGGILRWVDVVMGCVLGRGVHGSVGGSSTSDEGM